MSNNSSKKQIWIVSAAMLMEDGLIVPGVRHFSPDMRSILRLIYPDKKYHLKVKQQGFIDNYGNFLTREAAWEIAKQNNQIRYDVSCPGELFSENLY
jgi:hypothetical protein